MYENEKYELFSLKECCFNISRNILMIKKHNIQFMNFLFKSVKN